MSTVEASIPVPARPAWHSLPGGRYLRSLFRGRALVGVCLVGVVAAIGIVGPVLLHTDPNFQTADSLASPSVPHLLGTDELGRDLLSRVVAGIRVDLLVAFVAVPLATVLGVAIGLVASSNPVADVLVQRATDVLFAFPGFILAVLISELLSAGVLAIMVAVIVFTIPIKARISRNTVLQLRDREFVLASELVGATQRRVLFRHLLPNAADVLIVQLVLSMSFAVFIEGGLSFVGLGIQLPQPSLGNILNGALPFLSVAPVYAVAPMIPITLMIIGFNLVGDGLNRGLLRH